MLIRKDLYKILFLLPLTRQASHTLSQMTSPTRGEVKRKSLPRLISLCLISLLLSGCSTLNSRPQPRNSTPLKAVALYQKHETGQEDIQLAFVSDFGNWFSWRDFAGSSGASSLTRTAQNWFASYKGKTLSQITSSPSSYNNSYGLLTVAGAVNGLNPTPLINSEISFPGLQHRPVVLENMTSTVAYGEPLWKHATPPKAVLDSTLGFFENFLDNGLIEKHTLATEDLQIIDCVQLQNGDRVLTIGVSTLSNCDDSKRDKRFKSFYIRGNNTVTDLTAGQDVDFSYTTSTGLNLRFVDVVEHYGDFAVIFYYWDGQKKGYRLFVPRDNTLHDMDIL